MDCAESHCVYCGAMTRILCFAAIIMLLAGCAEGVDNSRVRVDIIESRPRPFSIAAIPLPLASAYLRGATAQGLVAFDSKGRVAPGLANRWIVTDDGLSYIFRLNKTRWNDGREVTSGEVADLLTSRIRELRKGRFNSELAVIDRVVPMTGKVVEVRLKAPMPYLLEMLAQPEFGLARKGFGSGPMQAEKRGDAMQLRLRSLDDDGKSVLDPETVTIRSSPASLALARYLEGQSDLVEGGRFEDFPLLEAAQINAGEIHFDPVPGLFGLLFVEGGPFLSSRENRDAIAMAIDRPKLLTAFDIMAWREALTLVPESLPNRLSIPRPDWAAGQIDTRKATAKRTIEGWENSNGQVRPLRVALPRGYGGRIFFARLRADMASIGLEVERVTIDRPHDLRLIDRTADQSSPAWYMDQLSCTVSVICSRDADRLVYEARMATTIEARADLLAQAETELQDMRNFIPIANPLRWSVARPGLLGHVSNGRGWHLLQYLGRDTT
ncbi:MAG TPA: ABC transporter substrate-binding protein [Sphingorhabdus lacus]|jgi:ABC-type transport system substrate-binding protein|nr:ABC transporter substrate-binding protein [Sphingorhabdus lacus]